MKAGGYSPHSDGNLVDTVFHTNLRPELRSGKVVSQFFFHTGWPLHQFYRIFFLRKLIFSSPFFSMLSFSSDIDVLLCKMN